MSSESSRRRRRRRMQFAIVVVAWLAIAAGGAFVIHWLTTSEASDVHGAALHTLWRRR